MRSSLAQQCKVFLCRSTLSAPQRKALQQNRFQTHGSAKKWRARVSNPLSAVCQADSPKTLPDLFQKRPIRSPSARQPMKSSFHHRAESLRCKGAVQKGRARGYKGSREPADKRIPPKNSVGFFRIGSIHSPSACKPPQRDLPPSVVKGRSKYEAYIKRRFDSRL